MQYLKINNLEKYHSGYKDRNLIWCKTYFTMINSDPEFEMVDEINKWRFIAFTMLQLQIKKPIPLNEEYLKRKGFDLKKCHISLTLQVLHNFITIVTEDEKLCSVDIDKNRIDKNRIDKEEDKELVNSILEKTKEITELDKTINSFIEMRKGIKKPITVHGIKLIRKELIRLCGTNESKQIEILNQSIMNSWQGVFPLKEQFIGGVNGGNSTDYKKARDLQSDIITEAAGAFKLLAERQAARRTSSENFIQNNQITNTVREIKNSGTGCIDGGSGIEKD